MALPGSEQVVAAVSIDGFWVVASSSDLRSGDPGSNPLEAIKVIDETNTANSFSYSYNTDYPNGSARDGIKSGIDSGTYYN